ncbi:hypothetical protein D9M70_547640 [compost metagenome]
MLIHEDTGVVLVADVTGLAQQVGPLIPLVVGVVLSRLGAYQVAQVMPAAAIQAARLLFAHPFRQSIKLFVVGALADQLTDAVDECAAECRLVEFARLALLVELRVDVVADVVAGQEFHAVADADAEGQIGDVAHHGDAEASDGDVEAVYAGAGPLAAPNLALRGVDQGGVGVVLERFGGTRQALLPDLLVRFHRFPSP